MKYPVIVISFATMAPQSAIILRQALDELLYEMAARNDIVIKSSATLGTKFKSLILQMAKKGKVVILIDEYDAAILKNIENFAVADACQEVSGEFFLL